MAGNATKKSKHKARDIAKEATRDVFSQRLNDSLLAGNELYVMSGKELAKKIGVSEGIVSHYKTGKNSPSFDKLKDIAGALNVSADFLLGLSPYKNDTSRGDQEENIASMFQYLADFADNDRAKFLTSMCTLLEYISRVNCRDTKKRLINNISEMLSACAEFALKGQSLASASGSIYEPFDYLKFTEFGERANKALSAYKERTIQLTAQLKAVKQAMDRELEGRQLCKRTGVDNGEHSEN
ncbi:MAG: helix-turn-helix domain-containing protein [Oscillospiraceae bacterium]|nr:helix-turn-helix domain-containing protein [Oscillospiraceae bacterium]